MTSEEINAYKNGVIAGLDIKEGFKYHLFGYNVIEILDIIGKHMMTSNLTKNEAFELAKKIGNYSVPWHEDTVNLLEKLGLIVFKPEAMLVVDHVDKQPMIIKRNGKIVYQD